MNTAQLTRRALDVIADSDECTAPIFRDPADQKRCQCGHPMPCVEKVPVTLCRAHARYSPIAAGEPA